MITTLVNRVTKTAMANSVKLSAPATRIGRGLVAAAYPAEVLFLGQFPLPHCPGSESNRGGLRQVLSAWRMCKHSRAMAAKPPVGSAEHPVPGSSACRRPARVGSSRASFPAARSVCERIGDCQSPDRRDDRWTAMSGETTPLAAAAI